jgi:uncharacterized protein
LARNLILTGGLRHPFDDASQALQDMLAESGIESEITQDLEDGLARLSRDKYDMLTVYALRWRMLGDEKYAPHRAQWAFSLSRQGRDRITDYVRRGGALFGLHTASICFDDWPEWKEVLGGAWIWGRSFHPPRGPVLARPAGAGHPITDGSTTFEVNDEVYSNLDLMPDVTPLMSATANTGAPDAGAAPVLWARAYGAGRVVYDALGHDRASLEQPDHRRIILRSANWLLGGRA